MLTVANNHREANPSKKTGIDLSDSPLVFSCLTSSSQKALLHRTPKTPAKFSVKYSCLPFCLYPTATLLHAKTPLIKKCVAFSLSSKNTYSAPTLC